MSRGRGGGVGARSGHLSGDGINGTRVRDSTGRRRTGVHVGSGVVGGGRGGHCGGGGGAAWVVQSAAVAAVHVPLAVVMHAAA